jgi:hypothetical protein
VSFHDHLLELIGVEYADLLGGADSDPRVYERALLSFLDSLEFNPAADNLLVRYPSAIHQPAEALACLRSLEHGSRWRIDDHGDIWSLAGGSSGSSPGAGGAKLDRFLVDFFTRLNGFPSYTDVELDRYQPPASPTLSCIVVLAFNDGFCLNHLIPSILKNTAVDVEVVLVNAGITADVASLRGQMPNLEVIDSDFLNPSTAYNRGVLHSRGEYIALFHDDCLLHDSSWFEKCLSSLDDSCIAVSPDCRPASPTFEVPKSVPMVMRRRDYLDIGGHHEALFASFEEIDFVLKILSAGKSVAAVDIGCTHFKGMSSYLMFGENPAAASSLFSYLVLPEVYISALANAVVCRAMETPAVALLHGRGLQYVVSRYPEYFPGADRAADDSAVPPAPDLETTLSCLLEQFHRHSNHPLAARGNPIKRKILASVLARRDTRSQPRVTGQGRVR